MTRWLERFAGLAVAALLTWPLILLLVQYPTLLPIGIAAVGAFLVGGYIGHSIGRKGADFLWRLQNEELDHEWRQLFEETAADHMDELASKDATISLLRRNHDIVYDAGVVAGQTFQADRQEFDL